MKTDQHTTIHRKDYQPPTFHVERIEMGFDLDPQKTVVAARLHLVRQSPGPLDLDGDGLTLLHLAVDGQSRSAREYRLTARGDKQTLTLDDLPDQCVLDVAVRISPATNTSLMGLYVSGGNFFTQCEAEGFRKIVFFPDRPDVMARYTVMLRADRRHYPVLLSNGNLVESGDLPDGRHYAKWEDPFPKPSYLFALVAGNLAAIERRVSTRSGRPVLLQVYTEKRDLSKAGYALDSLERSLRWDEERFGLELDLDRFMIVAVGDFNMGAMENKGLNIFNTKYVLADPRTETDMDFANVEAVVGHEYFHNWTGNRVTCRDWFQLTLKEGLTVFRDQEFSADMAVAQLAGRAGTDPAGVRATLRIDNVRNLRAAQFPEDAGPMAHPIRPESYQQIGNFYTATVYQKGSEVVRMQQTLLGRDGLRAGLDEYFRRHDGEAVSCDDFVSAMESVYGKAHGGENLDRFRRWYSQAGTPRVSASDTYDPDTKRYVLTLRQFCPRVGVEKLSAVDKQPFHIPFAVGLVDDAGKPIALRLDTEPPTAEPVTTRVLDLVEEQQKFVFVDVPTRPVPSLLRDFSAPVIVDYPYADSHLALLAAHDEDPFNRWEATQRLATRELMRLTQLGQSGQPLVAGRALIEVFRTTLRDDRLDAGLKQAAITLPSEGVIGEQLPIYDPAAVRRARVFLMDALADALADDWHAVYRAHRAKGPYSPDWAQAASRALKNAALGYLARIDDRDAQDLLDRQWSSADNMTDLLAAFMAIVNAPEHSARSVTRKSKSVGSFYRRFRTDPLVVDKWLRVQATAFEADERVLDGVAALTRHPSYSATNPNKVGALLGGFFNGNAAAFHRADGRGHAFWADQILLLDQINPSVAGRLARALERWRKFGPALQGSAQHALESVRAAKGLSNDVLEIVDKALSV
jgi:aminopeptidase N